MLYRAATGTWELIHAEADDADANVPLGILDMTTYTRQQVRLNQGDLLVLYTDALMEATSTTGQMLGTRGLLALMREVDTSDAGSLTRALLARVQAFAAGELDDDATIMVLTRNDIPPVRGSLATGLATTTRLAQELLASIMKARRFAWPEARVDNVLGAYFERFNRR